MASSDIGDWYRGIPKITRFWFSASVALPLIAKFGIVNPMYLVLDYILVFHRFQIWRPITALFFYPITPMTGFHYLIMLFFLYSYSVRLENGVFDGKPADYLFMLLFNWIILVIVGFIVPLFLLMDPMVLSVLYVWCQLNRDTIVSFWFGTRFKAMYLPWVLVGFNMIIRGAGFSELIGIAVGHLYFFLMFKYPQDFGGRQFLTTPAILYKYFPNRQGGVAGFGMAPQGRRPEANNEGRHRWGQGNVLGD